MNLPAYQTDTPDYVSPEEYLRRECNAEFKHEYWNGVVRATDGASFVHNRICANAAREIHAQFRQKDYSIVGSNQRLQIIGGNAFVYPDLTVVQGPPILVGDRDSPSLTNPVLLAEITSESTAGRDHYDKFTLYRQIHNLRQYLMLNSAFAHAELYTKQSNDHWLYSETRNLNAVLDLSSIGCLVSLASVYEGVNLQPSSL